MTLLRHFSSQSVPGILYLFYCRVAQRKRRETRNNHELLLSSCNGCFRPDTQEGKRTKTDPAWVCLPYFRLGNPSFPILSSRRPHSLTISAVSKLALLLSETVFFLAPSRTSFASQRSGCGHRTCLRPRLSLPGAPGQRSLPAATPPFGAKTQNLLAPNILSHPSPTRDTRRGPCWVQLTLSGRKEERNEARRTKPPKEPFPILPPGPALMRIEMVCLGGISQGQSACLARLRS